MAILLLVVLLLAAVAIGGFGGWIFAIIPLALAALVGVFVVLGRMRNLRLTSVDGPGGAPSTPDSSYDPRVDPSSTPTGSSTGTP